MKKKSIAIIGTNGLPGRYGGWDQLLNHFTSVLSNEYDIIVYTSKYNAVPGLKYYNNSRLKIIPLRANGYQSIFYDGISMLDASFKYDNLLILGTSGCIFLPFIKLINSNIILNPDGAEWKRGKWNYFVKKFLKFSENLGIKFSKYIISDNFIIQQDLKIEYNIDSFLIEYGGDHVIKKELSNETAHFYNITKYNYAFKVCRIEPENNLDLILETFSKSSIKLLIVGNWNNSEYGIRLKIFYKNYNNIILLDPIYDQEKLDELRSNCGIYMHGHSVGGTNPSLVEAMSLGLCCVVFDVNFNRVTTQNEAIFFKNEFELNKILNNFSDNLIDINYVGEKLKNISIDKYKWIDIIKKYEEVLNKK